MSRRRGPWTEGGPEFKLTLDSCAGGSLGWIECVRCGDYAGRDASTTKMYLDKLTEWAKAHECESEERERIPEPERVEAMFLLLVDSGDMTPMAVRQLRKVLIGEEGS